MVRVPHAPQQNFHHTKLAEAIACRNALCAQLGLSQTRRRKRIINESYSTKSSDLPVGVAIRNCRKVLADGTESVTQHALAGVYEHPRQRTRTFSLGKYGRELAINLAIEWRENGGKLSPESEARIKNMAKSCAKAW